MMVCLLSVHLRVYRCIWPCARIRLLMRRCVSIVAVMVILSSTLAPLVQAQFSTVPACCRVGGKHHCDGAMGSSGAIGFKSVPALCPYRHPAAVISDLVALTSRSHRIAIFVLASKTARPPVELAYSADRSDVHKRGPPTA
jgi:hypothetical protein